jgi:hypothetical protein
MRLFSILLALFFCQSSQAQTNIICTNSVAEQAMLGLHDPSAFAAGMSIDDPADLGQSIANGISADSLRSYIVQLAGFRTRNTGSDTVSATEGMGAARRWVHEKFVQFSGQNSQRLLPGYLQFDQSICSMGRHRNIMAVLPGTVVNNPGVVLIEGHIDSRCDVLCDVNCLAEGVEDNASGTALVMELARVMAGYQFPNTIVFLVTIGEEQGLMGAEAFADYAQNKGIKLRAVLNNDVIGGVICGKTSSPPSCPGLNTVDSTSVRLFSFGGFNSQNKQLARFIKLQYKENLLPTATVPMLVRIMSPEDRTGRGGDHIPFREHGYAAMRFTAANEHGDASNGPTYDDRQHTSDDVLGVDTDNDGTVDSFFVQFNYLARNAALNANAAAIAARHIPTPTAFTATRNGSTLTVDITAPTPAVAYRVALRTLTNDWDSVFTLTGATTGQFPCNPVGSIFVSVASVDDFGAESLFSIEKIATNVSGSNEPFAEEEGVRNIRLLPNRPNPFDEATWINFWVNEVPSYKKASVLITDLQGRTIEEMPVDLRTGLNEIMYTHGYGVRGTFGYALVIDGKPIDARTMVFAN